MLPWVTDCLWTAAEMGRCAAVDDYKRQRFPARSNPSLVGSLPSTKSSTIFISSYWKHTNMPVYLIAGASRFVRPIDAADCLAAR